MDKRRLAVAGLVAVAFLALIGITRIAVSGGADEASQRPASDPPATAAPADEPSDTTADPEPPPRLPRTSDPDEYASAVAGVVFGLDTTKAGPVDYRALLMAGSCEAGSAVIAEPNDTCNYTVQMV